MSAELGMVVVARATEVDSAIEGCGLRDRTAGEMASTRLERNMRPAGALPGTLYAPALLTQDIARRDGIQGPRGPASAHRARGTVGPAGSSLTAGRICEA